MGELIIVDLVDKDFQIYSKLFGFDDFLNFKEIPKINYYGYNENFMGFFEGFKAGYSINLAFQFNIGKINLDYGEYYSMIDKQFFDFMGEKTGLVLENSSELESLKRKNNRKIELINYRNFGKKKLSKKVRENLLEKSAYNFRNSVSLAEISFKYRFFKDFFGQAEYNPFFNENVKKEIKSSGGDILDFKKFNDYLLKLYGLGEYINS